MTVYCNHPRCYQSREVRRQREAMPLALRPEHDPHDAKPYMVRAVLVCGHEATFVTSSKRVMAT